MSLSSNNSVLSHLTVPTVQVPSNNQASQIGIDNQVTMSDIEQFANLDTTIADNSTNRLIHREVNPPQQISCLDICVHNQSRTRWGPGTYPTNYEVVGVTLWCAKADLLLIDPLSHGVSIGGECRSSTMEGRRSHRVSQQQHSVGVCCSCV